MLFRSVTTDLIVGFPTEKEEDFETSMQTIKKAKFADIHIFPYSRRSGTVASRFPLINGDIVKQRVAKVKQLRDDLKTQFLKNQIGSVQELLTEQVVEDKYLVGHTENFTKVYIEKENNQVNQLIMVQVKGLFKDGVLAEPR